MIRSRRKARNSVLNYIFKVLQYYILQLMYYSINLISLHRVKLGWAATNEKATNCRILSLFCRIFGGRQIATARNLKSDNLSLFCRLFVAFFVFFRTFLWFLDLKIFLFVRNSLIFVPIRLFLPDVTLPTGFFLS